MKLVDKILNEHFLRFIDDDAFDEYAGKMGAVTRLGEGTNGIAYLTNKNLVLKFTFDEAEAQLANELKNKPMKFHARVYLVKKVSFNHPRHKFFYIITKEYIHPLETDEEAQALAVIIQMAAQEFEEQDVISQMTKSIYYKDVVENVGGIDAFLKIYHTYLPLALEVLDRGANDVITDNIGKRDDGSYCFFDLSLRRAFFNRDSLDKILALKGKF